MSRTITEQHVYDRELIEQMAMFSAKARIVDTIYVGDFHTQRAEWHGNTLIVTTTHTPGDISEWRKYGPAPSPRRK